jgi:hypothetical protein
MAYGKNAYQGKYKPKNPEKYKGDPNDIVYRSSWERAFMVKCDNNPNVLSWSSETIIIPYISPKDGLQHRYFVDFAMKVRDSQGNINTYLVEIKPFAFTQPPKASKTQNKRFITEMLDYAVNQAKWEAAKKLCDSSGAKFLVLTERELDPSAK